MIHRKGVELVNYQDYLPEYASIEQSCDWLQARTNKAWSPSRLLECGLMPWFWLDYSPAYPDIFAGRVEGYMAPMIFTGDLHRLAVAGSDVLINMTRTIAGELIKIEPGLRAPLTEIRFKREDVARLVEGEFGKVGAGETAPADEENSSKGKATSRQDAMSMEINRILASWGDSKERVTATTVMAKLKNLAGQSGSCVVDISGDGVVWERADGKPETLTLKALEKRLARKNNPR